MADSTLSNYRYWQERGSLWPERYQERKQWQAYYHIQEAYLLDYFLRSGAVKVLEFGCGYGRHLRNLLPLEGLEVFGHDQSPTMIERMNDWADPAWMEGHVTLGEPVERLPYEDGFFDVVYTAEVLVHVRPQDLAAVLEELIRISRWQVLHLETSPGAELDPETHGGCWKHDLIAAYRDLGYELKMLTQAYDMHAPYRLLLDPSRTPYTMPDALARRMFLMEEQLQPSLDEVLRTDEKETLRDHIRAKRVEVENLERILGNMNLRVTRLEKERADLETRRADLETSSSRRIDYLERLVAEYSRRITQLGEKAALAELEATREVTRWKGQVHHLEQSLESHRRQAKWASAKVGVMQERMLSLVDKYDFLRIHLERMTADRDRYAERYARFLQSLNELADWGSGQSGG